MVIPGRVTLNGSCIPSVIIYFQKLLSSLAWTFIIFIASSMGLQGLQKNCQGKQAGPAERNDSRRGYREARASQFTSPPVVHSIGLCHDWRWLLALKSKTLEKTPSPEKCLFLFIFDWKRHCAIRRCLDFDFGCKCFKYK